MRSPNRTHGRQSFFKYMPADTAEIVLTNRTLRWSSPVLFNDPFDVPRELSSGLKSEEIVAALSNRLAQLIDAPPENISSFDPRLQWILQASRNVPPEVKRKMIDGIKEHVTSTEGINSSMKEWEDQWKILIPEFRILCLTESANHIAMWYHYAEKYKGAVLEFRCLDELDSASLAAKPVSYPIEKPHFYTANGWATLILREHGTSLDNILDVATHTKAPDWNYEKEWRITSYKRPNDVGLYTDYPFFPQELAAVYLGPMIENEYKEKLIGLANVYEDCKVYDVTIGMDRELHFTAL